MEQEKAFIEQTYTHLLDASTRSLTYEKTFIERTYTHLLVQAHARSRMTSARRHASMKNWKNTNPSSAHDDGFTKASMYEKLLDGTRNSNHSVNIHTSARASKHSLTYDECTKACIYKKLEKHKSIIRYRWNNKKHNSANIHTSARASTRFLTYDGCTKACMYEELEKHSFIVIARWNRKQHSLSKHTHICSCKHTLVHV